MGSRIVFCQAVGRIKFGDRVLVRDARAAKAGPDLANGTAMPQPHWDRGPRFYRNGETVRVEMDEGLGTRSLHALANGPLMDSNEIYLPAGRLSMAEWRAREAQQVLPDGDPA